MKRFGTDGGTLASAAERVADFELPLDLDASFERLVDLHHAGLERACG